MSRRRLLVLGLFGLKVAGMSVNGTSVSPSASAGIAQSGTSPSRPAIANPLLNVSRRLICARMYTSWSRDWIRIFGIILHTDLENCQRVSDALVRGFRRTAKLGGRVS